jgi:L-amino acid N-acyltransferase YncA
VLVKIRSMCETDADAVLCIYQAGLDSGHASFETTAPRWPAFDAGKLREHRYVTHEGRTRPFDSTLIETGVCCG